jgi:MFS family permease
MGHLICASCWGFITSWGAFQTYYSQHLLVNTPQSTISWIGSCQTTLIFLVGIASGRAMDAGYFHHLIVTGSILQVLGVMTMSVSTKFWQLLLSQGICFGVGAGLVFTPTTALLSTYFSSKRNVAMGISACGSCTGGLIFPSVVRELVPQIGFPWTVRILGECEIDR